MPYKRLDLPVRTCVSCQCKFKPRRHNQRFHSEACAQAWYHQQRKATLHATGLVKPKPHRKVKPWGWKRINGKPVYIPKGSAEALRKHMEEQL